MSERTLYTTGTLSGDIVQVYRDLIGDSAVPHGKTQATMPLAQMLEPVVQAMGNGFLRLDLDHRYGWMRTVMDVACIDVVCRDRQRKPTSRLTVEGPARMGSREERRQKLLNVTARQYMDWHFANRVRGWLRTVHGYELQDLRDDSRFKKVSSDVCDFLLSENGANVLVECKRMNTPRSQRTDRTAKKCWDMIEEATGQIRESAAVLGLKIHRGVVVIDVSAHGMHRTEPLDEFIGGEVFGFGEKEISDLASVISQWEIGNDEILLCWDQLFVFDGKPVAVVQYTRSIGNDGADWNQVYGGWSVVDCVLNESADEPPDDEQHIVGFVAGSQSAAWVIQQYRMISDNHAFWGKWEWVEE